MLAQAAKMSIWDLASYRHMALDSADVPASILPLAALLLQLRELSWDHATKQEHSMNPTLLQATGRLDGDP